MSDAERLEDARTRAGASTIAGASEHERQGDNPAAFFSTTGERRRGVGRSLSRAWLGARRAVRGLRRQKSYDVLRLEITGSLAEEGEAAGPRALLRSSERPSIDLISLLGVLRLARQDPAVRIVVCDIHALRAGWGRVQTVRRALLALRTAGKQVWSHLADAGMPEYYLASAADRVFLAPATTFDATGIASEVVFLKGALDKLGIEAQLARAGRFKSAGEPLTRTSMSDEHRLMLDELFDDLYAQLVADVAAERRLDTGSVRRAFEEGPLLPDEAVRRGLVDGTAYPDELDDALKAQLGDPASITLSDYQRRHALDVRHAALDAPVVGLLTVSGAIGVDAAVPAGRAPRVTGWRAFKREIEKLAEDRSVRAIILRVDSPGGSGLASDLMWREIVRARRAKPVLVSMGNVAASGGYYLAAAADHVTAEGATLTGSIGVIAGKPVLRGLYDQLGVTKELVVRGNATRQSDYVPLDDDDLARLRQEADAFYATFVAKVADGRKLSRDAVEAVAEGRVWSGRQAAAHHLVDELGGIEETIAEVKRRLGIGLDAAVALDRRPRARSWWQFARAITTPADVLAAELGVITPLLRGERLLAAIPFTIAPVARDHALAELLTRSLSSAAAPTRADAVTAVLSAIGEACVRVVTRHPPTLL